MNFQQMSYITRFLLLISFTLFASNTSFAQSEVTVSSIAELRAAMAKSDQYVTMTPGTYTVKDRHDATTVFDFSGSNNTFKFTDVTILIPTTILSSMDFNPIHAHVSYIFTGSNITFIDGVFEDVYPNGMKKVDDFVEFNKQEDYAPARQMTEFKLLGDNITLKGCTIIVRGSFPYGYGDMWGKGRGSVVGLKKHAGINVLSKNCVLDGVSLSVLAYGHGIFMQNGADNTLITNCKLQGRVRLGAEMLAEGEGSLPHKFDYTVRFGYLDGRPIPAAKGFALTEDGIRNYKGAGTLTVKNTTVTNFRGGMSLATGGVAHVENVNLVNCEHGYTLPGNSKVINSTGDASYGPVILCPYPQNSGDSYDIAIVDRPSSGDHNFADIVGQNTDVRFTYSGSEPDTLRSIVLGQKQGGGTGRANRINITNKTPFPILIKEQGENATGTSCAKVTDKGTNNKIVYSPCDFTFPNLNSTCAEGMTAHLLYSDDFSGALDSWTTEIETKGIVKVLDGKMDINSEVGSTVWFNGKLKQPLVITYEVTTLDDGVDGLPRDHNLFWMAYDPDAPDVQPSGVGGLGDYNKYNLYYAGIGGNRNRTTRFRRYEDGERVLVHESSDKTHLNAANQTYKMKIVCVDNKVQVYRDGQIYWDFTDENPYAEGWFGFRQTRTHLQIDNFKVFSVSLDN